MAKIQGESSPDAGHAPKAAAPGPSTATEPSRLPRKTRRFGLVYAAGLVVAIVAGIAIVLITMLPRPAPALPPMSNSLGFWDRIPTPVVHQIPPVSNDTESWDRVPPEARLAAQTHAETTVEQAAPASLGAMGDAYVPPANSEVMTNRAPAAVPAQSVPRSHSEALAAQESQAVPSDVARYGAIPLQEAQAYQESAAATSLPPMSSDVGYWDHIQDTRPVVPQGMAVGPISNDMGYWNRVPATTAASQSHLEVFRYTGEPAATTSAAPTTPATSSTLETFRYTGEPALDEAPAVTQSHSLEMFRYTGQPAPDVSGLASSTQTIRYPINVER
jgi:hypothetical protein